MKARQNTYFAVTDSTGHITTLVKNLRLKARIHAEGSGDDILGSTNYAGAMMVLHRKDVAFTGLQDNKMAPIYCEGSFTGEYDFVEF